MALFIANQGGIPSARLLSYPKYNRVVSYTLHTFIYRFVEFLGRALIFIMS